nr:UDP-GlcNAc:betaGal beta-1,3-N-acetylglucosaminyltransferase 7-like [Paramormyrops kingsleyae]
MCADIKEYTSNFAFSFVYRRDKWRMCRRVGLIFLLAAVALTIFQRSRSNTYFHKSQQTQQQFGLHGSSQRRSLRFVPELLWNWGRVNSVAATEESSVSGRDVRRTWDITINNCSANYNLSKFQWFMELENNFKQFLLYRHCRHFPMIINQPEKCKGEIYLLIVVKSIITQHDRREVIRKTWGREQEIDGKKIKTVFLLGTSSNEAEKANHQKLLEYENYIYGDILQWDFMDSFFNLTLKEIHFLKWFSMYCTKVHYIFKGDDDVFVGVRNVLEFLGSMNIKNLFAGDVILKAKPIRKKENKYYIPVALYDKTLYPAYAGGGGFLMDGPLARKLYGACETLDLFPIDDVFLGMCLQVLQVAPIKHNAFKTFGLVHDKKSKLNREPCFFKDMMVVHKLLPQDLLQMWEMVNSHRICSQNVNFS